MIRVENVRDKVREVVAAIQARGERPTYSAIRKAVGCGNATVARELAYLVRHEGLVILDRHGRRLANLPVPKAPEHHPRGHGGPPPVAGTEERVEAHRKRIEREMKQGKTKEPPCPKPTE